MGFKVLELGFWVLIICLFNSSFMSSNHHMGIQENISRGNVIINGNKEIGTTDTNFICATLDWWPPEKCDYGTCSWAQASILNLDLNNKILVNAVKAFSPLKLRLGGTLQDRIIYETEDIDEPPCIPFSKNNSSLFGFTQGCLPLRRWDQLNAFFNKSGAAVVFGLNVLNGRSILDGSVIGPWDPTNAKSLIQYSLKKGYNINILGWELGNELTGTGSGIRIEADQYALDVISFQNVIQDAYKDTEVKPLILAPGGFFNPVWFNQFLNKTTATNFDVVTHHIYNLGPGSDINLVNKILNPSVLDQGVVNTFKGLRNIINQSCNNSVQAWVGEAGGVYNSGRNLVTNSFVNSFWYLDQLGLASVYDTKTYCRQSLIGGNYGLLNTTTFKPNPDYYSALLWHRLMGKKALSTVFSGSKMIRAYTHCSKQSQGITLLLINLDKITTVKAKLKAVVNGTTTCGHKHKSRHHHHHHHHSRMREEYRLTGKDGNLQKQSVLLNGKELKVDDEDNVPRMDPLYVNAKEPITIAPLSILFAHIPYLCLPACL